MQNALKCFPYGNPNADVMASLYPLDYLREDYAQCEIARKIFEMLTGVPKEEVLVSRTDHRCFWTNGNEEIEGRFIYNEVLPFQGEARDDTAFFTFERVHLTTTPNLVGTRRIFVVNGVSTNPVVAALS